MLIVCHDSKNNGINPILSMGNIPSSQNSDNSGKFPSMDFDLSLFKKRLEQIIENVPGMNKKKLSLKAGLSETAIRDMLDEKRVKNSPRLETVIKIADVLGIRPDYFYDPNIIYPAPSKSSEDQWIDEIYFLPEDKKRQIYNLMTDLKTQERMENIRP